MDRPITSMFPDGDLVDAAELGAVTDRSIRVWLRQPGVLATPMRLEVAGFAPVEASPELSQATDWTGVIDLSLPAPAPDQRFTVHIAGRTLRGRFAPDERTHPDFTFAFGSCHFPFARDNDDAPIHKTEAAAIYPAIKDALTQADARLLLLIGDQLYADAIPGISVRDDLPGDEQHPPPLATAIDAYRKITRGFFAESGFRKLRESLPTLCIWDDHDIFNDWGSRLKESPLDQRLFAAANHVYREYQHARNPITTSLSHGDKPPYPYFTRFGTIGILALDLRGARSYEDGRLLGRSQWELIRDFLLGNTLDDIHTLFIVSSVPIAHTSRWLVELLQRLPWERANSVRDRWCSKEFVNSRDELLAELFTWQQLRPYRQAIVLSGDVHVASAFTIHNRDGNGTVHQFTSSAFTSPCVGTDLAVNWLGSWAPNLFESKFRFVRHFLTTKNNVGLIYLKALPDGGHRVRFYVRAWHPEQRRLVDGGGITVAPPSTGTE